MYIVRFSNHIQEDIKRNWSSINFGEEGFVGTEEELDARLEELEEDEDACLWISGLELYGRDLRTTTIKELYENYWVVVDNEFSWGLACNTLEAESLEEAIEEVNMDGFDIDYGFGECVDCSNAKVVHSFNWDGNQTYILEVED